MNVSQLCARGLHPCTTRPCRRCVPTRPPVPARPRPVNVPAGLGLSSASGLSYCPPPAPPLGVHYLNLQSCCTACLFLYNSMHSN